MAERGYIGLVLPRGALAGSGTKLWRQEILEHARFSSVSLLTNTRQWVFEEVHPQYNVGLVCIQKSPDHLVAFNGPFHSEEAFVKGANQLFEVAASEFQSWSSTAVFPWLPDEKAVEIFLALREHPRFDVEEGFAFRPTTELHTTANKSFYDFDLDAPSGDIRVLTGGSFNLWNPDFGPPYAYAHAAEILPFLEGKLANQRNNRRSAFYGLTEAQLTPRPWERARIAFRNVARATDSRTVIACLLPPHLLTVEPSPYLMTLHGGEGAEAYLLGVLSTPVFDWYARRFVELHLTFEILNPMPIPRPVPENPYRQRVITIAGRLAAVDDRYASWAKEVGVEVGSVNTQSEKDNLIAELDAVVAHLYGLTEAQLVHIFETFHIGWNYHERLERVRAHYQQWEGKDLVTKP